MRHFLSSDDVTPAEQAVLIDRAIEMKNSSRMISRVLEGCSVGLIFEKPSTRTRIAFETAVFELGGHPIALQAHDLQLDRGESLEDTAQVLSGYLSAIVLRTFGQERLDALAETSTIPVVNALSDLEHPCQALADVMTVQECFEDLSKVTIAYLGDGNNVCHSLLLAGAKAGIGKIIAACPNGFEPIEPIVERAAAIGLETGCKIRVTNDPAKAARGANVLYTDVWTSMGQEEEKESRRQVFQDYNINSQVLDSASPDAVVMHCLPAHREEEISTEVMDGPRSVIWQQAANRLPAQKALMEWLLTLDRAEKDGRRVR
ncbi:MAG TPA: ornithine carbamoyltransferase [Actinomycetota bacterium]|jgi:ornithine carbamoyltransferase|nr:ornithine carbamoyltransferase [Actinomycetota bacterium]